MEMERLTEGALALVPEMNAVVLSDYEKGALNAELCQAVIRLAHEVGIPVLADPKSRDLGKYHGATTVCPNMNELSLATGAAVGDLDALVSAGQQQVVEHGFGYMTLTMSEKGIRVLWPERSFHSASQAREVYDVSGAGDTVIATLAAGLAGGLDVETAVQLANMAAAIVVGKRGTVAIQSADLVAQLTQSVSTRAEEKILELERLQRRVTEWRATGETIVFTNGCFDILHVGHIELLETCRRYGSKLVVGLNTDASVAALKGPSRPIVGEKERARIMAALAATDAVVLFAEETPLQVIRGLRPDVIVKGGDYQAENVVGYEDVRSWGGRVEIVPTVEGFSTTNIVKKLSD
jgi:D-beta-D-heptose 7-phosphate kinase/D-beta-D-heptose 1-phosphate adenosyltransferase